MRSGLLFILALSLFCCGDDHVATQTSLNGKWVEINTRTDTLTFLVMDENPYVTLDRGREIRNGHLLPKIGSGIYRYRLFHDSISLYWTLSSNSDYNHYYFNQTGDALIVGNFYDPDLKGARDTFKKLN